MELENIQQSLYNLRSQLGKHRGTSLIRWDQGVPISQNFPIYKTSSQYT